MQADCRYPWLDFFERRLRLLADAGVSVALMTDFVGGMKRTDLQNILDRLGIVPGYTRMTVDDQIRALHACQASYTDVMTVVGYKSANTIKCILQRLGLPPHRTTAK